MFKATSVYILVHKNLFSIMNVKVWVRNPMIDLNDLQEVVFLLKWYERGIISASILNVSW